MGEDNTYCIFIFVQHHLCTCVLQQITCSIILCTHRCQGYGQPDNTSLCMSWREQIHLFVKCACVYVVIGG